MVLRGYKVPMLCGKCNISTAPRTETCRFEREKVRRFRGGGYSRANLQVMGAPNQSMWMADLTAGSRKSTNSKVRESLTGFYSALHFLSARNVHRMKWLVKYIFDNLSVVFLHLLQQGLRIRARSVASQLWCRMVTWRGGILGRAPSGVGYRRAFSKIPKRK